MGFQKKPQEVKAPKAPEIVLVDNTEKFKALFSLSKALDKKHDTQNSLMRVGDKVGIAMPSICTGLPTWDYGVFRTGGAPRGRIIEIFGPESAGKTTATLHIIAEEQKAGGIAAFVDAEHALDPSYAAKLGVDVDNLVLNQPNSGEEALQVVDALVDSKAVTLIVVDSVAALVPEAELAGEIGDAHVGLQARMMSQAMRILTGKAKRNNVTVIFINQIREKIGVMYGNPETTTGGRALKFYSSVRLKATRGEAITLGNKENIIGHQIKIKAVKNKCGVPFGEAVLDLYYETGFDKIGNIIEYSAKHDLFQMSGSWFHMDLGSGMERIANGVANLKEVLRDNPKAIAILRANLATKAMREQAAAPVAAIEVESEI